MAEENQSVESTVREIRRKTRKKYSAEEKVRIVLEGLRGEFSVAELCRKEGIHPNMYYPLVGGTRQRRFDGINFEPRKLPENAPIGRGSNPLRPSPIPARNKSGGQNLRLVTLIKDVLKLPFLASVGFIKALLRTAEEQLTLA